MRSIGALYFALLTVAAFVVLAADLAVHIAAHLQYPITMAQAMPLTYALFAIWLFAVMAMMADQPPYVGWGWRSRWRYWRFLLRGGPRWLLRVSVAVQIYFFVNIALLFAAGRDAPETSEVWFFTGFLLFFFWPAFAIFYANLARLTRQTPYCPNGHEVNAHQPYCTTCGAKVEGFFEY